METSAYAISSPLRKPAFTVSLPPTLYVSGGFVVGEVELDYEVVCDDDIERIYVELQGTLQTCVFIAPCFSHRMVMNGLGVQEKPAERERGGDRVSDYNERVPPCAHYTVDARTKPATRGWECHATAVRSQTSR